MENEKKTNGYKEVTKNIEKKELELKRLEDSNKLIQTTIETLQYEMKKGFQELSWIHDDALRNGGVSNRKEAQYDEERAYQFQHQLNTSKEEAQQDFYTKKRNIEKERDALYKKRSELAWD